MNLLVDLHTHTVNSGHAYSTLGENAKAAAARGLKAIGVTDHGPALPGGAHDYHFWNLRVLPDEFEGVRLLKGIEANIIDESGRLDLDDDSLKSLDVVLIGFHPKCGYESDDINQNTTTLIKAMSNPLVHIVVHPGNPWFPVDPDKVVEAAAKYNVMMEMNNSSFVKSRPGGQDLSRDIGRAVYESGQDIILGSDAHWATQVGHLDEALYEVEKIGFTADRIINTSPDRVYKFLKSKREE
jgi:putative hydrolase